MAAATAAERLRQLQQQSQFFDPMNAGPVIPGGPSEEDAGPELPGMARPEAPSDDRRRMVAIMGDAPGSPAYEQAKRDAAARARGPQRRQGFNEDMAVDRGQMQRDRAAAAEVSRQQSIRDENARVNAAHQEKLASGILPGEEQVTSQDTFGTLSPEEQKALRGKYDTGGHSGTMTFEDWLSENYAELPPEERAAQMRTQGAATPRIQAGRDPNLEPGQNSGVAKSRQAAGKPLPEGREASQYTPDQRRTMQRNVHSPEVPMQRFGGTFTPNVDGSLSSRAPNPAALKEASAIAADQGEGSPSHIMALANAYGIDAAQYGDDMDMLRADVMREKERHDRLAQKYDVVSNNMGGFRYTPNSATNEMVERRKNYMRANAIGQRFAGMLSKEQEAELDAAAGDNMNQRLQLQLNRGTAQAVRNNIQNRNMTIAANNPRVAQGLYMRSLQEAARSGDPFKVAAVHSMFGNDRAARDYMSLAGQQQEAAAAMVAAEAAARQEKPETPKSYADQFHSEVTSALAIADPVERKTVIVGILTKMGTVPPEQVEKKADELIASASGGPLSPQQTRTWFQFFTGGGQSPGQQQATMPAPATPQPAPQQPPKPSAPPASGRGAGLDNFMSSLPMFRLPSAPPQSHPYYNRSNFGR